MSKTQRAAIDARLRATRLTGGSIAEVRAGFAAFMGERPLPAGVKESDTELAGLVALELTPEGPRGTILYFHGGSWVVGSPRTARQLTAALVSRSGARAFSVDYRLAPEHPFPAAIADGVASYRALLENGVPASEIVTAGDSAGGGLALLTLIAARDAGLPMPAGSVTFSPGLDNSRTGESMRTKAGVDPLFTRESLEPLGALHRGDADPGEPLLSPAVHADLTGLPPLLLQVGTNEVLLDDSTRFAVRAAAAGVDVILDVTGDVPHVFQMFEGELDEADAALDRAGAFVRDVLSRAASGR